MSRTAKTLVVLGWIGAVAVTAAVGFAVFVYLAFSGAKFG